MNKTISSLPFAVTYFGSLLLMEGGETSSQFFRYKNWHDLTVSDAFETGIVALSPPDCDIKIIIKPGSYKWPEYVLNPLQEVFHGDE